MTFSKGLKLNLKIISDWFARTYVIQNCIKTMFDNHKKKTSKIIFIIIYNFSYDLNTLKTGF